MNYPDFLCIGLPKTGTTWVYHHLKNNDNVWLPPIKELAFMWGYDRRNYSRQRLFQHRKYIFGKKRKYLADCIKQKLGRRNDHALSSLKWDLHYALLPQTESWYKNLFPDRSKGLRGDISPQYHVFEEREIAKIYAMNPALKIILILRNPVGRLWSYARMKMVSSGRLQEGMVEDSDWKDRVDEGLSECPDYLEIINRWSKYFENKLKVVYYDELVSKPQSFLSTIEGFLELPAQKRAENNLSTKIWEGRDVDMPEAIEKYLIEQNIGSVRQLYANTNEKIVANWLEQFEQKLAMES